MKRILASVAGTLVLSAIITIAFSLTMTGTTHTASLRAGDASGSASAAAATGRLSSAPVNESRDALPIRTTVAHKTIHLAARSSTEVGHQDAPWHTFVATWYSPEGGIGDGTTTATGARVKENWTIAVDPKVIPLGSFVEVRFPDGNANLYHAEDTGGAIRGNHIDIFSNSEARCLANGVQRIQLRIIGPRGTVAKKGTLMSAKMLY